MITRIAVLDDQSDIVESIKALFQVKVPYIVVDGYTDPEKALPLMRENPPMVLIMDISMPRMDGWQVTSAMRSDPVLEKVPIIYLTAKSDDMTRVATKYLGADYITKPFDNDDLIKRVKNVLNKHPRGV